MLCRYDTIYAGLKDGLHKGGDIMGKIHVLYRASLAVQVRMSIRCPVEMNYEELVGILKQRIAYNPKIHRRYILGFYEECSPHLMKAFMKEQQITREEIIELSHKFPTDGEIHNFRKAVFYGEF